MAAATHQPRGLELFSPRDSRSKGYANALSWLVEPFRIRAAFNRVATAPDHSDLLRKYVHALPNYHP